MMNLIQLNQSHCNAILAYECCGLPWFRGVSQYSWPSPTQLGPSENILKAKKKMSHNTFYFTRNYQQQEKF
jgi:hypothetical protein